MAPAVPLSLGDMIPHDFSWFLLTVIGFPYSLFGSFFFLMFIYLFLRESKGGGAEREGERESQAGIQTHKPWDHDLSQNQEPTLNWLSHPGFLVASNFSSMLSLFAHSVNVCNASYVWVTELGSVKVEEYQGKSVTAPCHHMSKDTRREMTCVHIDKIPRILETNGLKYAKF